MKAEVKPSPELGKLLDRPRKRNADPFSLKEKLKSNRSRSPRGHGEEYWDSVVKVIEDHYELLGN